MSKRLPKMKTDQAVKKVMKEDLSDYLNETNFKAVTFEFAPKDKSITLRVSSDLLKTVQGLAKKSGIDYQKLIRQAIEEYVKRAA